MIRLSLRQSKTVKIGGASFTIRPLSGADVLCITCEEKRGEKMLESIRRGVIAWDGVESSEGVPIAYAWNIDDLPADVLAELAGEIWKLSTVSESDEKKSVSVPVS